MIRFNDRIDAGKQLAIKLKIYHGHPDAIVIALPRGGVVTGYHIAQQLNLPLDIVVPRKIGAPFNPELAVGAITEDGSVHLDKKLMVQLDVTEQELETIIAEEKQEAQRRLETYRGDRPPLNLENKIVILVDDGVATGATMKAAIKSVQTHKPQKIIVVIPVAPADAVDKFTSMVDKVIVLATPEDFVAISQFYTVFDQTEDEEVIELLKKALKAT
jgi:putative phosphoribosyl transferase